MNNNKKANNNAKKINNISQMMKTINNNRTKTNANLNSENISSNNTSQNSYNSSKNNRTNSPYNRTNSPGNNRTNSPNNRSNSPNNRSNSPNNRTNSPNNRSNSPNNRSNSPGNNRTNSPNNRSNSPGNNRRNTSPNNNRSGLVNSSNISTTNNNRSSRNAIMNSGIAGRVSQNKSNNTNNRIEDLLEELDKESKKKHNNKNNSQTNDQNNDQTNKKNNTATNAIINVANNAVQSDMFWSIIKVIMIGVVFIIIINIAKYYYTTYENYRASSPWLLDGNKNAKHALVISQNPDNKKTPKITRSDGQNGVEFTYVVWMLLDDPNYKQTEWKHVFHKGNEAAYPTIAPGVWIHPNKNMLRVYMNTLKQIREYVDIDNIPLRKWIHLGIIVKNEYLEVYINGYLKVKHQMSSLPRQNNEDLWLNLNGGFEGFMSKMRYYNYAIGPSEFASIIKDGPANTSCIDTAEIPPYLDDNWWF